jgi:hypothetical protein
MDGVQTMFLGVSTMALCAIVGIYYIWVRKLPQLGHRAARQS